MQLSRCSVGHHCKYNLTEGDCGRMAFLEAVLKRNNVDLYLAGHDHSLQYIDAEQVSMCVFYLVGHNHAV